MWKLKGDIDTKLQSMILVFLPEYREVCKLPPSPRWISSQGCPHKGQAIIMIFSWIALGTPTHKFVSRIASHKLFTAIFTIEFLAKMSWALLCIVYSGSHTTNRISVILQAPVVQLIQWCMQAPIG